MSRSVGDSSTTVPTQADTTGSESRIKDASKRFISAIEMQVNQQMDTVKDKAKDINTASVNAPSARGYNWLVASIIVVADLVGGGLVAMPAAFHDTGMVIGCIFLVLIAIFFTSTAHLLSQTWTIMRDRWPVYKTHCRQPYPEIGLRSYGPKMRQAILYHFSESFTVFCVNTTLFGVTTVYVILSSSIFHKVLVHSGIRIHFCLLLIILAILILPITFLKSPADFWVVLAISLLCTVIAAVLIAVGITEDYSTCIPSVVYKPASFYALYSLGTFVFAYSGHHVFPTIQHDMHEPKEFSKSVLLGFFCLYLIVLKKSGSKRFNVKMKQTMTGEVVNPRKMNSVCTVKRRACCLYIPLSVYAYFVYGQSMEESLIDSIQTTWIRHGADLAVAFHCVLTIILTINPVNQQFEHIFHVPHKMCWQRIAVRTGLLAVILFVALSIPNFGSIMDFFGSTTIPFTCIILPTLFGLSLKNQRYNEKTKKWKIPTMKEIFERTPRHILIWFLFVNVLTIIASMISAVMAVRAMATIRFVPPCYVQPFLQSTDHQTSTHSLLKCCGKYSNITRNPEIQCFPRINH
ncbi:unnamed protein product [Onchocerca flexuosa]|uniref:Aa_trans domain-containing protein n=1 Tax=Onchocerca flexuosa TaxID=387005 RepID=A0A183I1Z5_9BILA|nr:unnamed protein product [Onchocerca flexuosa]